MGFPSGTPYTGAPEQKKMVENSYLRKAAFMKQHGVPIWNGEFGPVYADPRFEAEATSINQGRLNLLGEQLRLYQEHEVPWSIWIYKDIGFQGMLYTDPESKWNKTIAPFLAKKKKLQLDGWGTYPSAEPEAALKPLVEWVDVVSPAAKTMYPTVWPTRRHVQRAVFHTFLANSFSGEFASLFKGMRKEELEEPAMSFHFDKCIQREPLNKVLQDTAK